MSIEDLKKINIENLTYTELQMLIVEEKLKSQEEVDALTKTILQNILNQYIVYGN